MSTLLPTPTYNPHVPIITSAGGTSIAYKDPNSPESILKKTTEIQIQSAVDTKYDIAIPAHVEGFRWGKAFKGNKNFAAGIIGILCLYMLLPSRNSRKPFGIHKFTLVCVLSAVCFLVYLYKRYGVSG